MSVFYQLHEWTVSGNNYGKVYARAHVIGEKNLSDVSAEIQKNCSMKASDVNAVLTEMQDVLTNWLQSGYRVAIDSLGSFKIGIRGTMADSAEDFSVTKNIKGYRVIFTPEYTQSNATGRTYKLLDGCKVTKYSEYTDPSSTEA